MVCFSRSSRPCGARPRRGLAEPAERPRRERSDRSGLGAVRRVTAQQAPVAAQADRKRSAGATELDRPCRRGSAAGADVPCGGVGWLAELRNATACRRVELKHQPRRQRLVRARTSRAMPMTSPRSAQAQARTTAEAPVGAMLVSPSAVERPNVTPVKTR